jgi:hypothetical protein
VQQAGLHPFTQAWKLYEALRAVRTSLSGGRLGLAWQAQNFALVFCSYEKRHLDKHIQPDCDTKKITYFS